MRGFRGAWVFCFSIFILFSNSSAFAYCQNTNKSEAPVSPLKGHYTNVPDKYALQLLQPRVKNILNYNDLKILIWNIAKGDDKRAYGDLNRLSQDADLVLVQEGYLDLDFQKLFCARADLDWRMATSFWDRSGTMTGVVTAGKQTPSATSFIRSPDVEPFLHTPKMILVTEYEIPMRSETLLLVNVHGINFVGTRTFERQMLKAFEVVKSHKGPVIFGGDFNTRNIERTRFLDSLLRPQGIERVNIAHREKNVWGFLPFDHLYQRGFDVVASQEIEEVDSSDHKPLYFELKLR